MIRNPFFYLVLVLVIVITMVLVRRVSIDTKLRLGWLTMGDVTRVAVDAAVPAPGLPPKPQVPIGTQAADTGT